MTLFEEIDKEFIRTHKFSADVALIKYSAQSFRISGKNLPSPPDELQSQLRKNFAAIMAKAFYKDYAAVESRCYIRFSVSTTKMSLQITQWSSRRQYP